MISDKSNDKGYGRVKIDDAVYIDQTVEAFSLLASKFNKGTESIDALALMTESLEKGTENVSYLGEFSNAQNKIFKN